MGDAVQTPALLATLETPKPITCADLAPGGLLAIGSEDGTLRFFNLPSSKAQRAIIGLGEEVTSTVFAFDGAPTPSNVSGVWVAFGTRVAYFDMSSKSLVMKLPDASAIHTVLDNFEINRDDVLNEIALHSHYLAYTSDSGATGVLDLSTGVKQDMRTQHSSIAGSVSYVPDRPSEMVTGGYDSNLLHFDYRQKVVLSRYSFESAQAPDSGDANISLSPPFVTSLTISSNGVIAAGAANGRLWIGFGGERIPSTGASKKKKKRRYWEGLKDNDDSLWTTVAQGPVVGVQFASSEHLITCSLGGRLVCLRIGADSGRASRSLDELWTLDATKVLKVNAMKVCNGPNNQMWIVIGGIDSTGKGCAEIYGTLDTL